MITHTAFQPSAFQSSGFQEADAGGTGGYRKRLTPYERSAFAYEVARRARLARQAIEEEERKQREERERIAADVVIAQPAPIIVQIEAAAPAPLPILTSLNRIKVIDVDRELQEFGDLMMMLAECDEAMS